MTLGNEMTLLSHKNLTQFHLVLWECSCLTQTPYCEEAQRAVIKQPVWEELNPPAHSFIQHQLLLVSEPPVKWIF